MSYAVLVTLVVLWALGIVPGMLRARRVRSAPHSIKAFTRSMALIAHQTNGPAGRPLMVLDDARSVAEQRRRSARAARRRRLATRRLATLVLCALVAALAFGGPFWVVLAAAAAVLGGYVVMLHEVRVREAERRRKVRMLRPGQGVGQPRPDGAFSLTRRSAG